MVGSSIRMSYTDNHIKLSLDQTTQATEYTAEPSVATKIARYFKVMLNELIFKQKELKTIV